MNVLPLNEIKSEGIVRTSTGMPELDKILGISEDGTSGMADGSLIMLAGTAGTGKSRLAIEIGTNLNRVGHSTLTFQLEVTPSDFKGWTKNKVANPSNFFVSPERDRRKQIEIIKNIRPKFVIVDSVNRYDVSYNEVAELIDEIQDCARETGAIVLMIGQLDKKGNKMMVRGSQDWTFLPDVVVLVYKDLMTEKENTKKYMDDLKALCLEKGIKATPKCRMKTELLAKKAYEDYIKCNTSSFVVAIPDKNRFGRAGGKCVMRHTDEGVIEV